MAMIQEPIDWRYLPYIWLIFQAYVRGYIPSKYGLIWYSTSILGSWHSHWSFINSDDAKTDGEITTNLPIFLGEYQYLQGGAPQL